MKCFGDVQFREELGAVHHVDHVVKRLGWKARPLDRCIKCLAVGREPHGHRLALVRVESTSRRQTLLASPIGTRARSGSVCRIFHT